MTENTPTQHTFICSMKGNITQFTISEFTYGSFSKTLSQSAILKMKYDIKKQVGLCPCVFKKKQKKSNEI